MCLNHYGLKIRQAAKIFFKKDEDTVTPSPKSSTACRW